MHGHVVTIGILFLLVGCATPVPSASPTAPTKTPIPTPSPVAHGHAGRVIVFPSISDTTLGDAAVHRGQSAVAWTDLDPTAGERRRTWVLPDQGEQGLGTVGLTMDGSSGVSVAYGPDGTLHTAYSLRNGPVYYRRADGQTWSSPQVVVSAAASKLRLLVNTAGLPHLVVLRDTGQLAGYQQQPDGSWAGPATIWAQVQDFEAIGVGDDFYLIQTNAGHTIRVHRWTGSDWDGGSQVGRLPSFAGYYNRPEYASTNDPLRVRSGQAQKMFSTFATHDAGFYRQAAAPDGSRVTFKIWVQVWSNEGDEPISVAPGEYKVQIGIDSQGGTDPLAQTILWSGLTEAYDEWVELTASATAHGGMITLFTRGIQVWRVKHNDSYWDDARLYINDAPAALPHGDFEEFHCPENGVCLPPGWFPWHIEKPEEKPGLGIAAFDHNGERWIYAAWGENVTAFGGDKYAKSCVNWNDGAGWQTPSCLSMPDAPGEGRFVRSWGVWPVYSQGHIFLIYLHGEYHKEPGRPFATLPVWSYIAYQYAPVGSNDWWPGEEEIRTPVASLFGAQYAPPVWLLTAVDEHDGAGGYLLWEALEGDKRTALYGAQLYPERLLTGGQQ